MIKDVFYSYLNPENLTRLSRQSIKIITDNHPNQDAFIMFIDKLDATTTAAEAAIGTTTKEQLTDTVYQLDTNRDQTFIGLRDHLSAGQRRHRNQEYASACMRLLSVIVKHGRDISRLPYNEESAVINALINEITSANYANDLDITHTKAWVNELQKDQEAFENTYVQRTAEKVANTTLTDRESVKLLKPELNKFYTLINAFYLSDQIPNLEKSIDQINDTIDRIVASAKR
ncbi:DUF6261 family protein [Aquimarina sp. W85]|uniref:DUF6261 family protein n=1 Tax=Aquimarina rhodophyticola TaxID=3342246 RepID=UPI00366FCADC